MFERLQNLLDRIESRIALWYIVAGSGIVSTGAISAWIAAAADWLDAYGAIAWWFAGLIGALIAAIFAAIIAWARYRWIKASATRKWKDEVDAINPLATEFHKQRLNLSDVAHPMSNIIAGKRFTDCDILGPANIVMRGNGQVNGANLNNCDIVVMQSHKNMPIFNVILLQYTHIIGGDIWKCTIYITQGMVPAFREMGAEFITLTGDPEIDGQTPPSMEQNTKP